MKRVLLLASVLLLLVTLPLAAQQPGRATLSGTVVDAETGAPLEGAHVFIAVSMTGTTTDAAGRYRLANVPLGAHRLYVSIVGYEPEARNLLLREARVHTVDFRLPPAVVEVGEVTVEAERDARWAKRLETFTRLFIGETPNAAETKIVNPEVLDFDEAVGRFTARAAAPLLIENRALGYRIQYFLKDFEATPGRTKYDGEPLYEELTPEDAGQAAQWEARRREAFLGSFRHFMLAVLAGRTEEQGFKTYSRPAAGGSLGAAGPFQQQAQMGDQRFPLDPQELLKPGETPTEKVLDVHGFVEIIYTGEVEDEAYLRWSNRPRGSRPKYRTSWIRLENGPTVVDYKGDVLDPYGVTFFGYLAFERVADEVPREYRPR